MTASERRFLWNQYPEIREMFEDYNGILLEDDLGWKQLACRCYEIMELYHGNKTVEILLLDTVDQLDKIAKKRLFG